MLAGHPSLSARTQAPAWFVAVGAASGRIPRRSPRPPPGRSTCVAPRSRRSGAPLGNGRCPGEPLLLVPEGGVEARPVDPHGFTGSRRGRPGAASPSIARPRARSSPAGVRPRMSVKPAAARLPSSLQKKDEGTRRHLPRDFLRGKGRTGAQRLSTPTVLQAVRRRHTVVAQCFPEGSSARGRRAERGDGGGSNTARAPDGAVPAGRPPPWR